MIVGILKEIKTEENRVCMTPAGVEVMIQNGHTVLVEKSAGAGSGFADEAYVNAGAKMIDTPKEIFDTADMVMHVKEPLPPEYDLIREDDRIDLVSLANLTPNQSVSCIVNHADGTEDTLLLNHTYNLAQVEWFKAGSALNLIH